MSFTFSGIRPFTRQIGEIRGEGGVLDDGGRPVPGGDLLAKALGGVTEIVTLSLRLVRESGAGQRIVGIANGVFGENADSAGPWRPRP